MYDMEYIITFNTIDVTNEKFAGDIDITFHKWLDSIDPITGLPHYRDYPDSTIFPFYANVDFKFICKP